MKSENTEGENRIVEAASDSNDGLGGLLVPVIPEPARIESMCYRFDHGHGLQRFGETPEQFERRKESNRTVMRQLYEEATGQGFFNPKWVDNGWIEPA